MTQPYDLESTLGAQIFGNPNHKHMANPKRKDTGRSRPMPLETVWAVFLGYPLDHSNMGCCQHLVSPRGMDAIEVALLGP